MGNNAVKSDIEIARDAKMLPIKEIAKKINIDEKDIIPYGKNIAKIDFEFIKSLENKKDGKLILVTAISPTPAGEGKTTTSVGLGDALNKIGKKTITCLREPSLGPVFGMKGGAAGGGYAQVVPMENINLHFTGDLHAIGAANNLLAALIDNHIYWDNEQNIDTRRITWRRAVDMNDRSLRNISIGLGGITNGFAREDGFNITVASEVMAIFCLAKDLNDLQERLGNIIIGKRRDRTNVYAKDINAQGAMTALLKDAFMPNLVQTLENNPAFIHGGPFANIAHGCNSVIATKTALKLGDYVVTEAGFGADLGAEKFFDIKCVKAGLNPCATVIVATVRALKMHGGMDKKSLGEKNNVALSKGLANLGQHIENIKKFGVPSVVAINRFSADEDDEISIIKDYCQKLGVNAIEATHWADGSEGTIELAKQVVKTIEEKNSNFAPIYDEKLSLWEKMEKIAKEIYRANGITANKKVKNMFDNFEKEGFGNLPICVAKTQYSFSTDPNLIAAPTDFEIPIREIRLAAGAGFLIVVCGDIMTMPGLPRSPASNNIFVNDKLQIEGLF
jgi:formate--tetrahydrofolate ligase